MQVYEAWVGDRANLRLLTAYSARELGLMLENIANGNHEAKTVPAADVADQIRIILFAREMGWLP